MVFATRAMRVSRVGSSSRGPSGEVGRAGLRREGRPDAMEQKMKTCMGKGSMSGWMRADMMVAGSMFEFWAFFKMEVMLCKPRTTGGIARAWSEVMVEAACLEGL